MKSPLAPHNRKAHDDYAALGIRPTTWACVAVMDRRDARDYVIRLAEAGVPALLAADIDGQRWHVAIQGGLAACPTAWLASIRPMDSRTCQTASNGESHPMNIALEERV